MNRAPRRYTVTRIEATRVALRVHVDSWLGDEGTERVFWVPPGGGYVREERGDRHGTLGRQVCDRLGGTGSTLWTHPALLAGLIRREAAALLRAEAREFEATL